jgi:hypothetical protein
MIGTTGATVLFIVNSIFASVLGIGTGGLACLALRKPWSLKAALIDAVLAAVVAAIAAYAVSAVDMARGELQSRLTLIFAIAVGSVVLRHLLRRVPRSPN